MNTKIVINRSWGGFGLSGKAFCLLATRKGYKLHDLPADAYGFGTKAYHALSEQERNYVRDIAEKIGVSSMPRHDKDLVAVVEELGTEANGNSAELVVRAIDLPSGRYNISDYDGMESIIIPEYEEWITVTE